MAIGQRIFIPNEEERLMAYKTAERAGITITTQKVLPKGGFNVWRVA